MEKDQQSILRNDISNTLALIHKAFEGKYDKAGQAYEQHLMRVASACGNGDVELYLTALLHDLLEDCPEWTSEKLLELYSPEVVIAVELLSHAPEEDYFHYIQGLKENRIATLVKLADLQDNMDLSRLPTMTAKDRLRIEKYQKAYQELRLHAELQEWKSL